MKFNPKEAADHCRRLSEKCRALSEGCVKMALAAKGVEAELKTKLPSVP